MSRNKIFENISPDVLVEILNYCVKLGFRLLRSDSERKKLEQLIFWLLLYSVNDKKIF